MLRNKGEGKESEEERERFLQQLKQQLGQSADFFDTLEKRLHESEEDQELLDALFEYFPGGVTIAAAGEDKIRMVSKYSRQFIGCSREDLEGLPLQEYVRRWDVLHLDGVTPATAEELPLVRATRYGEVVTDQEWLIRCRDGRTIRILCNAGPIRNRHGNIIGGVVAWRDITERQRVEEQFREVATLLPAAVYLCDASGLIKWYNSRAVELWGREPDPASTDERFCGSYKIYHPDGTFIPHWEAPIAELLRTGIPVHNRELIVERPDGSRITVMVNIAPIKNEQGEVTGAINCFEDITERKQAEQKLRQSEERYRRIVETAAEGIKILDQDGRITYINSRGASLLGCSVEEMLHYSMFDFVFPENLAEVRHVLAQLFRGTREEADVRLRRKDGSSLWVHYVASPIPDDRGGYNGALFMFSDITPRKEAEKRALQAERLAAIGQMATGLAHESGNALQRSQSCLRMLALRVKDRPEALDLVNRIQKAQDHLQYLLEDVRGYAAPLNLELRTCDLSEVWREAWSQLDISRERRDVTFREETGHLDLHCHADYFRLVQVFRNLFDNALTACRDPVVIEVRCSPALLTGHSALCIAVRDNGPGIATEERSKIFEPFYTTKTKGTGLGLAIVRRIIEAHGGEIVVSEGTDSGAEFLITLPRGEP
jgi:two-component system sensor kinase FixL